MFEKKHILIIDAVLIIGSLLLVAGFVGYTQPFVIAPLGDSLPLLFSFPAGNSILIDTNLSFNSSQLYLAGETFSLDSGKYYWKVVANSVSDIRVVTLESPATFKLAISDDDSLIVINGGSEKLSVTTYNLGENVGTLFVTGLNFSSEDS
ncbi:hypothetical protein EXS72_01390 [Candidatus Pacearchaeota archaeon]|nr:hypothetical protein [Candidatus Pacearchaeota archaeon]